MQTKITLPSNLKGVHFHFVGIKGTGMAALVEIFVHNGAIITGSDVSERFYSDEILEKLNIKALQFAAENITDGVQFVVYSSAYKLDVNPDLIEAVKRGIPCLLYTEALGAYSARAFSCGICGVHGKTSTTGLVGTILKEIDDIPSQVLAGSVINSFGGTCTYTSPLVNEMSSSDKNLSSSGENLSLSGLTRQSLHHSSQQSIFVAETCEYQRHFMSFCPQKIILTSVESDHEDYYPTYESIRDAFVDYVCKLPEGGELIYCADDKGAVEVAEIVKGKRTDIKLIPYGLKAEGEYKLTYDGVKNEKNCFSVKLFEDKSGAGAGEAFALSIPGKHEVLDADAALALVCQLLKTYGKNPLDYKENIARGLLNFSGGKRRSEIVGNFKTKNGDDVLVIDDYGHHPTAIKTTLAGYRDFYKNRKIIVDFMSHTYSRTQALFEDFASSFDSADVIILNKIYSSARENPGDFSITGKTLYDQVVKNYPDKSVKYFEEILDGTDFVLSQINEKASQKYSGGYLFVTMGAGDNWKIGRKVLEIAENNRK